MARVSNWNPAQYDGEFREAGMERCRAAMNLVADKARANLRSKIGKGKTTGISHGPYKKGKYKGLNWTAREFGSLLKTVRVREKEEKYGKLISQAGDVRVYVGNYLVWYAAVFEYVGGSYLRKALNSSKSQIKTILEQGVTGLPSVRGTTGLPSIQDDPGWIAFRNK